MGEAIVDMPVWFDEHTVARRWGVSVYTVQRERKRGRLKAKRLGGRWKYRSDWLREYEDEATPCQSDSRLENGFSTNGQTVRTGASVGSIQKLDKHDVHHSAQRIFKSPRSGLRST